MLDVTNELHDPPVVEPGFVVEVAAQLLGQAGDGALRHEKTLLQEWLVREFAARR